MSKHLGNVLEPIPLMEAHGADAVRWFFAAAGSPWSTRRIGAAALDEIVRKVLLTYWNTVSFLVLYANAAAAQGRAWGPGNMADAPPAADRPLLDRWLLSELHAVTADVTDALEGFDTAAAGPRLAAFIDDLSNWYVRRSRRRFWEGPATPDSAAAFATLYECLETLTRLMAPMMPFLTDYVWGVLRTTGGPDSVHLAGWPQADQGLIDRQLSAADGAHPAAGGTRPVGPGRRVGADPAAAPPGPRGRLRLRPTCHPSCAPRSPRNSTCGHSTRWPRSRTTWWITSSSRTSALWAAGSASGPRRWRRRSPRVMLRRSRRLCVRKEDFGPRGRRTGAARPGRRHRDPDTAVGLDGGDRGRRDGRARSRHHA